MPASGFAGFAGAGATGAGAGAFGGGAGCGGGPPSVGEPKLGLAFPACVVAVAIGVRAAARRDAAADAGEANAVDE